MNDILVRKAKPEDTAFITSTWLRSYRYNSFFTKNLTNTVYYQYHTQIVGGILGRGVVYVACDVQSPETIFGYLVTEALPDLQVIHYAYVKKAFRQLGVFTKLIENLDSKQNTIFTHFTDHCKKLVDGNSNLTYNPYLIS